MNRVTNRRVVDINSNSMDTTASHIEDDEFTNLQTIDELRNYSRVLHSKQPRNIFEKVKIPWKTISLCIVFFILGSIFLFGGIMKWNNSTLSESYEFILLGLIMFIPGSYHTFILIQILRGVEGYDYDLIDVLDQE